MERSPAPPAPSAELRAAFGGIDLYLFDQLLRGRFDRRPRILDAGCGDGRNLPYFLSHDFDCFGIDDDPSAISHVRKVAAQLAPGLPADRFHTGDIESLPWDAASMDAVISSAVLHFSSDEAQFGRMVLEMWRVLAPEGLFFARLASNIGLEDAIGPARRRAHLPDGSERFIVDERMLMEWTERLGGRLLDPIKTTIVQRQRCMTTWCLLKPAYSPSSSPTPLRSST